MIVSAKLVGVKIRKKPALMRAFNYNFNELLYFVNVLICDN
jgi:hypothetical protein